MHDSWWKRSATSRVKRTLARAIHCRRRVCSRSWRPTTTRDNAVMYGQTPNVFEIVPQMIVELTATLNNLHLQPAVRRK